MTTVHIPLPGLLDEIEQITGREAAVAIAVSHGGLAKEFPAPERLAANPAQYADNWLVMTVGSDAALAIVEELFPIGGRAEIPAARTALRRQFVLDNINRLAAPDMATALELTERGIRSIKASLRKEGLIT